LTSFLIEMYDSPVMAPERREAIYQAFDSFQEILEKVDSGYGHCDECGGEIYSKDPKVTRERGLSKSMFVQVCTGFDGAGEPVEGTDCLLAEHLRRTQRTDTD